MKVTMVKRDLNKGLGFVKPYAGSRNTLPILSGVFVQAGADGITLSGTDLENAVKVSVAGTVIESGDAVVNLKECQAVLKGVRPEDYVNLHAHTNFNVQLGTNSAIHTLSGYDPSEYPDFEFKTGGIKSYSLPGDVFRSMLSSTVYAASTEETRYFLNGVYFNFTSEKSDFVATDGRRIALSSCEALSKLTDPFSCIVPLGAVKRMLKTFNRSESVKFGINKAADRLYLTDGALVVYSRLVEGEYPKYHMIFPEGPRSHKIVVNVSEFLEATQQMLAIPYTLHTNDKKASLVRFDVGNESMKLSTKSKETDADAQAVVPIESGNGDLLIGFDGRFIADALGSITTEKVEIEFGSDGAEIVLLRGVGVDTHLSALMPMRLDK